MNKNTTPALQQDDVSRLLRVLAEPGSFARQLAPDDMQVALFRLRRGLTLGAGQVDKVVCSTLVNDGLAAWTAIGKHRHLVVSAAGLASLNHGIATMPAGQQADGGNRSGLPAPVKVNHGESPLAWLRRRRDRQGQAQISDMQFLAGERLRADLELAQMLPRVTANWSSPVSGPAHGNPGSASDTAVAARERVTNACRAAGPEFSGLLIDVCGFLKGLEQVEAERDWPARSAKLLLRMGLDRLALHYGLSIPAATPGARRAHSWQSPDARPRLMPAAPGSDVKAQALDAPRS